MVAGETVTSNPQNCLEVFHGLESQWFGCKINGFMNIFLILTPGVISLEIFTLILGPGGVPVSTVPGITQGSMYRIGNLEEPSPP